MGSLDLFFYSSTGRRRNFVGMKSVCVFVVLSLVLASVTYGDGTHDKKQTLHNTGKVIKMVAGLPAEKAATPKQTPKTETVKKTVKTTTVTKVVKKLVAKPK